MTARRALDTVSSRFRLTCLPRAARARALLFKALFIIAIWRRGVARRAFRARMALLFRQHAALMSHVT